MLLYICCVYAAPLQWAQLLVRAPGQVQIDFISWHCKARWSVYVTFT